MPRAYRQLDLDERRTIFRLLNAKVPVAAIAQQLGRHRSTIHREISRNHFHAQREYAGYYPLNAQDLASERRQRRRKLLPERCPAPLRHRQARALLVARADRRAAEAGRRRRRLRSATRRSTATSTARKAARPAFTVTCPKPAASGGHATAASRAPRSFPPPASIQHRPPEVEDRQTFGHWEADLLIFRREHGKANLTSMIERQTRFTILLPNPDRQSNALIGRIGQAWQGLPEGSCRTVTFDRGTEFAAYGLLAERSAPKPTSAIRTAPGRKVRWRTPTVGSAGSCQASATWPSSPRTTCQRVATLNATPRRCLGYRTPNEAFQDQLAALPRAA